VAGVLLGVLVLSLAGDSDGDAGGDAGTLPVSVDDDDEAEALADGDGEADGFADGVADALADGEADVVDGDAGTVPVIVDGVGDGVVVVGVGDGVVGVGVGDADAFSDWHCEITELAVRFPLLDPLAEVTARLAGAIAVLTTIPVVVASRTPPVMRPSDTGRTRAKHMEDPARAVGCSSTCLSAPAGTATHPGRFSPIGRSICDRVQQ
jgi:hypothetical protein